MTTSFWDFNEQWGIEKLQALGHLETAPTLKFDVVIIFATHLFSFTLRIFLKKNVTF